MLVAHSYTWNSAEKNMRILNLTTLEATGDCKNKPVFKGWYILVCEMFIALSTGGAGMVRDKCYIES